MLLFVWIAAGQTPASLFRFASPSLFLINTDTGAGSGFCIGQSGLVATSLHVIDGVKKVSLIHNQTNNEQSRINLMAVDTDHDLAILQLTGQRCTPLKLGDSNALQPGQRIYVLGNPLGSPKLTATVSDGLISGIRSWDSAGKVTQISAPLSHDNSGGPVLDEHGMVIGVVAFKLAKGELLNFAIPSSELDRLAKGIKSSLFSWGVSTGLDIYQSAAYQLPGQAESIFTAAAKASGTCEITDGMSRSEVAAPISTTTVERRALFRDDFREISYYDRVTHEQHVKITQGVNPDVSWEIADDGIIHTKTPSPDAIVSQEANELWVYCPNRAAMSKDVSIVGEEVLDGELADKIRIKEPMFGGTLLFWSRCMSSSRTFVVLDQ